MFIGHRSLGYIWEKGREVGGVETSQAGEMGEPGLELNDDMDDNH